MLFLYKGLNGDNVKRKGYISADTRMDALNKLREITDVEIIYYFESRMDIPILNELRIFFLNRSWRVGKTEKKEESKGFFEKARELLLADISDLTSRGDGEAEIERSVDIDWEVINKGSTDEKKILGKKKIKNSEIIIWTKKLNMMLMAGVSLSGALKSLEESSNRHLAEMTGEIIDDITGGKSFSKSISNYPKYFDLTYISMVSVGEDSGNIPKSLGQIIEHMERYEKIESKLKTASIYPVIIGLVLLVTIFLGSTFFIPQFEKVFADSENGIPGFTRLVFKISNSLPVIILFLFLLLLGMKILRRFVLGLDRFIYKFTDKLKLKTYFIRDIFLAAYMYNISSTLEIMLDSGIRLKDAVDISRETIDNIYIQQDLWNASKLMVKGYSLSEALSRQVYIDPLLVSIVETGEESGDLQGALAEISNYYNYELNTRIDNALEMIQPILMILVGLVAIPVIIAIYLPILNMSTGQMLK